MFSISLYPKLGILKNEQPGNAVDTIYSQLTKSLFFSVFF